MDKLRFYYDEFEKKLNDIELYLQSVELQKKMIRQLDRTTEDMKASLDITLQYGDILKQVVKTPIQYNAIIISIYGSFEQYIDNIFEMYCKMLYENIEQYSKLPDKMLNKHIKKLGDYLLNPQRYRNYELTVEQAIKNAHVAFTNPQKGLDGNKKLILSHGGNLRIDQISELARDVGIEHLEQQIVNSYAFKEYYLTIEEYTDEIYGSVAARDNKKFFERLENIVEERNNVAHGWIESRTGIVEIKEKYITYMRALAESICDILIIQMAKVMYTCGKLHSMGNPIKVYDNRIVCINNGNVLLKRKDYLVAVKEDMLKVLQISSLKVERDDFEMIEAKNVDVGIGIVKKTETKVDERYTIYCFEEMVKEAEE